MAGQVSGFFHQIIDGAGDVLTPHQRDGAEGAGSVAAFANFQVGVVARRGDEAFADEFVLVVRVEFGQQARQLHGAEKGVDLGDFLGQFVAVALRQAPGHVELVDVAGHFYGGVPQNGVDTLLFCQVDKSAGIDDYDVGILVVTVVYHVVFIGLELGDQVLTVHQILGATQGNDVDLVLF